jgi:hypothetical protein
VKPIGPPCIGSRYLKIAQIPTRKAVSFDDLAEKYGAIDFQDTLADFIAQFNHPGASAMALHTQAANTLLPFHTVSVFHKIKFSSISSEPNSEKSDIVDTVDAWPEYVDSCGHIVPPRFDTVLVRGRKQDSTHGIHGECHS